MKKTDRLFSEIYAIDSSTNSYMIEIELERYEDIFSEWDGSPFKRREIDSDFALYLEGSSDEIPFRYPIELYFKLPAGRRDPQLEENAEKGLKNSFAFKLYLLRKEFKKLNLQMLRYISIGLVFLWVAAAASEPVQNSRFLPTLVEGLSIAGWVFLGEGVSLFYFTKQELRHRYKTYRRLQNAPILFREADPVSTND